MKFVVCIVLLALVAAVSAQPGRNQQLTEEQLEAFLRPCIVDGVRCPPDGSMSYAKIQENMAQTKMMVQMFTGRLPSQCECDDSSEQCNRRCMYAMMKVLITDPRMQSPPQKRRFIVRG